MWMSLLFINFKRAKHLNTIEETTSLGECRMRQKVVWSILGILLGSLFVVFAYQSGGNIHSSAPAVQRIDNTVPVYCIGGKVSKYFKETTQVNSSLNIRTPHILVVESSFMKDSPWAKEFVKRELLSGIPIIVLGKPDVLKDAFKGQFFAEVVAGKGNTKSGEATVYGYVVYPSNGILKSKEFASFGSSQKALREAYKWALSNLRLDAGTLKIESMSSGA